MQLERARRLRRFLPCAVLPALTAAFLCACSPPPENKLAEIKQSGELKILTYENPTTYYENPEGPTGFEYDLAQAFADHLGVKLTVILAQGPGEVLTRLARGDADLAAAGLSAEANHAASIRFTIPYQDIRQQVIYRRDSKRPVTAEKLVGREIEVPAGTASARQMARLKQKYPALHWTEVNDKSADEVLLMVWQGLLEITVVDSHLYTSMRQHLPELQVAFDLPSSTGLAWALPANDDTSLFEAAEEFLRAQRTSGVLAQLVDRYYGPASRSNFVNASIYQLRVRTRLPQFQAFFEQAGAKHNVDWRLLAAIGYQESYWDPDALSPTGVRGFMMLTQDTAADLGVTNRHDPAQSATGAALYLRQLIDRMPARVPEPDRTWFALAAYNVGFFHLEDARILTQQQGGDPDKWNDVMKRLPLLSIPKWYEQAKYGYCRGIEPVQFVNRVRTYHEVLAKYDEAERAKKLTRALKLNVPAI